MIDNINDIDLQSNYNKLCLIMCTTPDDKCAHIIAESLLVSKLAACVTLLPSAISCYYWQGIFNQKTEVQLLIKSCLSMKQEIFKKIKSYHPYQVQELLVIPITDGDHDYLSWINKSLK